MAKKYDESSVKKLRGIEPVQRLPGMYTRTSDPTHIIQEAIDNAADEAIGGHAFSRGHRSGDGSTVVTDNGRIDRASSEKIPNRAVLTELHAGASSRAPTSRPPAPAAARRRHIGDQRASGAQVRSKTTAASTRSRSRTAGREEAEEDGASGRTPAPRSASGRTGSNRLPKVA